MADLGDKPNSTVSDPGSDGQVSDGDSGSDGWLSEGKFGLDQGMIVLTVIHAYPTQAEAIKKAADACARTPLSSLVGWLSRKWVNRAQFPLCSGSRLPYWSVGAGARQRCTNAESAVTSGMFTSRRPFSVKAMTLSRASFDSARLTVSSVMPR